MLGAKDIVAFVPTRNPARARAFYEGILGLRFVSEDPFALVLDANGVMVRVANVSSVDGFAPASFTILGWLVDDIAAAVEGLSNKGVKFEKFPAMEQDKLGVWSSPSGAKIAWFKDPEGNVLSLTEH
ncbi:MAG: VOC family protein [Gemmatimonadota bacterium]|nr:VOC family protein [Gemmatimonadota bacterium]